MTKSMQSQVTRADVARRAGVSKTTVSYVMSGRTDVSIPERTRLRVIDAAQALGYQPNQFARSLKTGRTNIIAVWTPYIYQSFYTQVVYHVQQHLKAESFEMMISDLQMGENDAPAPMRLTRWPVDGVIAIDASGWLNEPLKQGEWNDIPIVSIGAFYTEFIDHVGVDLTPASREAVQRLLASGRRRVAYMKNQWRGGENERQSTYESVMQEAGRPAEIILTPDYTRTGARDALTEYIRAHGSPDGIFCQNDDFAIGAYRALHDLGLRIPDDVALVGCNGIEDTELFDVPISTISVPIGELCRLGWQFLHRRMTDRSAPLMSTILQPELIVRASLGVP